MKFYHCSPNNFNKFTSKYNRIFKCRGVFVAPHFKDIVMTWANYAFFKKSKKDGHADIHYSHVYVYTLQLDKETISEIKRFYKETFESKEWNEAVLFSFWWWGEQLFIPEDLVDNIKIINKKTYTYREMDNLRKCMINVQWDNVYRKKYTEKLEEVK